LIRAHLRRLAAETELRETKMANRILLADDSITIQKVVNLTFADEGIEVVAVSNGDQAERRLADVRPDLVLADIFMPGKNGYELCEAIKNNPQHHYIPVVLLVGAFEPFDQAEAHRVKADAHLTKPFESRTLVDTVRKLISASSKPRTGPLPALPVPDAKAAPLEPLTPAPSAMRPTTQMTQPFNLDLSAMASTPPAPVATMPLSYTYGASDEPLAAPIEVQVAEAPAEPARTPESNLFHQTDDLSFAETEPPFEAFGLDDLFAEPAARDAAPNSAAAPTPVDRAESGQESGRGVPSAFGYAAEEMLLDFDQPAPVMTRSAPEPFAFDIDVREPASVDASGIEPESPVAEVAAEPEVLKTTLLEMPAPTAPVETAINTNPLEMPAPAFAAETGAAAFATDAAADNAALFNVDDPLGDVLDEGTAEAAAPLGAGTSAATVEPQVPEALASAPGDYEVEFPATPLTPAAAPESVTDPSAYVAETPAEPTGVVDPGFGFAPVVEKAESFEGLPPASDAHFTTASMWTNEEARFAAIDIEATPVEEPAEVPAEAKSEAPAESFKPTEGASVYTTQPEWPAATAAPVAEEATAATPNAPAASAAAPAVELSPALMDEIVRRVVAQLSESVVREIAWEVVPDCVERVIKDMTAQEVAKR
jgi:CheY-like chemotaxis protein